MEHPFGTIKRWWDGYYTLLIGKKKVAADISLLFLGYNLKRAISMLGVQELKERMRVMKEAVKGYFSCFFQILKILRSKSALPFVFS